MSALDSILDPGAFSHVFERWRGATVFGVWAPGNTGDLLICAGAERLYRHFEIKKGATPASADVIFYGGGGNMGTLYPGIRRARLRYRKIADKFRIPLIVLPQSWTGPENFPADQLFVRENRSLQFCPNAVLAPDLGLAYSPEIDCEDPREEVGWFMRNDRERRQSFATPNDPARIAKTAAEYVILASHYQTIHTDRLHFAVAAMLAKRSVKLYRNSYYKNEAIYNLWLKGRGCMLMDDQPGE